MYNVQSYIFLGNEKLTFKNSKQKVIQSDLFGNIQQSCLHFNINGEAELKLRPFSLNQQS